MIKKIIGILVVTLMFASVFSVATPVNKKNTEVTPFPYTLPKHIGDSSISPVSQISTLLGKKVYGSAWYGWPQYGRLVSFTLDNPGTINNITDPTPWWFLSGGDWANGIWWGCEFSGWTDNNSKIWKINSTTGEMTLVGPSGFNLHGLAYDDTTGNMYACNKNLYTIDMLTGEATLVGSFQGLFMIDIACDSKGNLYGETTGNPGSLFAINKTTALCSRIGWFDLHLNYAQDMAFDKDEDKLYLAALTVNETGGDPKGALYYCNHYTAACTKIGDFVSDFANVTEIDGFAIPYTPTENQPPNAPVITGETSGKPGKEYEYTFNATDPDGDDVRYFIDWGDNNTEWTGFNASGTDVKVKHKWSDDGTYNITAKAQDIYGLEGPEGTLTVNIPRSRGINKPLLLRLFERLPNLFPMLRQLLGLR